MASRLEIVKMLAVFGELYPRTITEQTAAAYELALSDLTDDELQRATSQLARTAKFFPKPSEIRDAIGANVKPKPDVAGILSRIRGLTTYHPNTGDQMPSVERVRQELGDAIANAYGYIGPRRLEAVVFDGVGTGADIAAREFAAALDDAQDAGQLVALPPVKPTKQISNASQSVFYDNARPEPIGKHIAGLLAEKGY